MVGFVSESDEGTNGGRLIDARLLSDGTLRMLAVVTAPETVPERSRIIIEEFDSGLHPSRAKLLVQEFTEAAERRKLNIVVTTHNPAFMDAIDESQMDSVLLCHRDESQGASRVTRLRDLNVAGTLVLRGGLGEFVTSGALETHLAPGFTERRVQATREWGAASPDLPHLRRGRRPRVVHRHRHDCTHPCIGRPVRRPPQQKPRARPRRMDRICPARVRPCTRSAVPRPWPIGRPAPGTSQNPDLFASLFPKR